MSQVSLAPTWGTPGTPDGLRPAPAAAGSRGRVARALAREVAETVLLMLVVVLAVRGAVQPFRVEGPSMAPTLGGGQYLLIDKVGPVIAEPRRGDVVVFHVPGHEHLDFVKRVIGLPGDTVRIADGRVFLNGEALDEPYLVHGDADDLAPTTVPPGAYFVLGDNRPESTDSRRFGVVPAGHVVGIARAVSWPPAAWTVLHGAGGS